MSEIQLPQEEADRLIAMKKRKVDDRRWAFHAFGARQSIALIGEDQREEFLLDIERGRINFMKVKYQTRGRKTIALVRLDIEGPKHTNPDGEELPCPHIHIYREGFADQWAIPLPSTFAGANTLGELLLHFFEYCQIVDPPHVDIGVFS